MSTRPAAFLDRDGVLNATPVVGGVPRPPRSVEELEVLPGVDAACTALRECGVALVVVTNQPDVARGTATVEDVLAINDVLADRLRLDAVMVCTHDDADGCHCRKPLPGMLLAAADRLAIDLSRSAMVGDRWKDIAAGRAAGVATILVDHGYEEHRQVDADWTVTGLAEAVPIILDLVQTRSNESCQS